MTSLKLRRWNLMALLAFGGLMLGTAAAQLMTKTQVADLIAKVENGVDEFRDYLKRRGDNAPDSSQKQRTRRNAPSDSQKATAAAKKDDLHNALDDLNQSTNRLRRKFDATDTWMTTKAQVQKVVDDGRKINQAVTRGNYGSEVARLWGVLRGGINNLARAYGIQPLGA